MSNQDEVLGFDKIKHILESNDLNGVKSTDVDWFLRDSAIAPDESLTVSSSKEKTNDTTSTNHANSSQSSHQLSVSSVSPHIHTNISNSNVNNETKTKPSIAPIQHENVSRNSVDHLNSPKAKRGSISSLSSTGSNTGGFFSKLKGKFQRQSFSEGYSQSPPKPSVNHTHASQHEHEHNSPQPPPMNSVFKADYDMSTASSHPVPIPSQAPKSASSTPQTSATDGDPRLEEYIKFYQQPDSRRRRSSVASDAVLFSALANSPENCGPNSSATPCNQANYKKEPQSKFSFLRRKTISGLNGYERNSSTSNTSLFEPAPPAFKDLKPLKRVAFHSSTFLIDPPQQIPSRNPRKGNVEITQTGSLKIHPLTDEDKAMIEKSQLGQGGGLVVGGTGALGYIKKEDQEDSDSDEVEESKNSNGDDETDTAIDAHMKSIAIDKPIVHSQPNYYSAPVKKMALDLMYTRCCHLREILPIPAILKQIPKGSMAPIPLLQLRNPTPTMVEIQTFADFLRIAPIICISFDGVNLSLEQFKIVLSAMSAKSQLEKLSLRNTPIDHEGWSLLCWFLSRNKALTKLDITQCPSLSLNILKRKKKKTESKTAKSEIKRMVCNNENRSEMDWSLFVATMVARGGMDELILTGCCINDVDIFEKLIKMAVAKRTSRLGLAYNKLGPKQFKILADNWLFSDMARGIDLGYNDFSSLQMLKIFLDKKNDPGFEDILSKSSLAFLSLNSTNLRFSDMFKEVFESIMLRLPNLKYLDLSNNQSLFGTLTPSKQPDKTTAEKSAEESIHSSLSTDSYISGETELSSPAIVAYFNSKLPLFPKLIRLHLENNNFSSESLIQIAKVLPFCKNLGYFSLLGNPIDLASASALIQAVKNSSTLITLDCNYDNFPALFKERLGLYSMRNMERLLYASQKANDGHAATKPDEHEHETISESLTEQLNKILSMKAERKLDLSSPEVVKFIKRANSIRSELKTTINELLRLQLRNELSLEGKETLVRFIFIDSSIETGLSLIDNSLVQSEPTRPTAVFRFAAEDEKNKYVWKDADDSSATVDVPNDNIPISTTPLSIGRSTSRTNLNNLNREEGSIMKLSSLHKFHHPSGDIADHFKEESGEEIRKKIMGVDFKDLDMIIKYLNHLKGKGVSLENVYNDVYSNKEGRYSQQLHDNAIKFNEIEKKLEGLINPTHEDAEKKQESNGVESHETTIESNIDDGDAINKAYDELLKDVKQRFDTK